MDNNANQQQINPQQRDVARFEGIDDNEFGGEDVRNIFNRDGFIFLHSIEDKKTVIDADAFLAQTLQIQSTIHTD